MMHANRASQQDTNLHSNKKINRTCMLCLPVDIALEGRDFTGDVLPLRRFAFNASATPCCHSCPLNVTINNSETTAPDCTCDTSCPRLIAGSFKFVFSPPDTTPVPVLFRPLPDLDLESSWSATFNCSCCYKCKWSLFTC